MKNSRFVHLHNHTQYSLLDGISRIDEIIAKAKSDGMTAVAITDHGNTMGIIEFYKKAVNEGIKPIIGMEVYVAPDGIEQKKRNMNHLVLLAENQQGLQNLRILETKANLEGFYHKPRVDKNMLKLHHSGLIALTGCLAGQIPKLLLAGQMGDAIKVTAEYLEIFGPDNLFLEIQDNGLEEQARVNKGLIDIGAKLSIRLVATNDCHYLDRQDAIAHDVMLCIQTQKTVQDTTRLRFGSDQFYFKTQQEMIESFQGIADAIDNTVLIAERCNVQIDLQSYHFPQFSPDENYDAAGQLRQLAQSGLAEVLHTLMQASPEIDPELYRRRLEHELSTIIEMGFADYFLIVEDLMRFARQNGIATGPGRGSAAGSLVSFVLGITGIDPVEQGLIFERFLNPERISMPDIDLDFCVYKRDKIVQYLRNRYGADRVAHIMAFGNMKARAVLRDVGRALGIDASLIDRMAKAVPDQVGILLKDAIEIQPMIGELARTRTDIAHMFTIAQRLEGLHRHGSKHAAGLVISDRPLVEYLALGKSDDGSYCTNLDMKSIEDIGMVKLDILALSTLSIIDLASTLIQKRERQPENWPNPPKDDPATYQLLCTGQTTGIFQLESDGMKGIVKKMQPTCFSDLVALTALYRPGPLGAGMDKTYIARKHGRQQTTYLMPALEPILSETYGVILYQEQVMHVAAQIAGYSMGEADILRKAMGKKNAQAMEQQRHRFLNGACKKGYERPLAEQLFDQLAHFAGYGFAKSHSAAYALIAYQTAFLKANYPVEFMTACLACADGKTDDIVKFVNECRQMGITVLPPDVNVSHKRFSIENGQIRYGLQAIKFVGEKPIDALLEARGNGGFNQLAQLRQSVNRSLVNARVLESLIHAGALDSMGYERQALLRQLDGLAKKKSIRPHVSESDHRDALESSHEHEMLGLYMGNHPVTRQQALIDALKCTDSADFSKLNRHVQAMVAGTVDRVHDIVARNGRQMCFVDITDAKGVVKAVLFAGQYAIYRKLLDSSEILVFRGPVDERNGDKQLIVKWVYTLSQVQKMNAKSLIINVEQPPGVNSAPALIETLRKHKGRHPVLIHLGGALRGAEGHKGGEWIPLVENLSVNISEELVEHLQGLSAVSSTQIVYA